MIFVSSPWISPYRRNRLSLSLSLSSMSVLSLVSHPPLSLQLLFILSRSICIIFKFKYTALSAIPPPSKPSVYRSPFRPLVVSVISFLQSALVACTLTDLSISHPICSLSSFYNNEADENNIKVYRIL